MASGMVAVKLTWEDNSTGTLNETGQEIEIWTDSPTIGPYEYSSGDPAGERALR